MDQIYRVKCEQFLMVATENEDICKYAALFDTVLTTVQKYNMSSVEQ